MRGKVIPIGTPDIHEVVEKPFSGSRSARKFDDLTLNEYIQLARGDEAWAILGPYFGVSDTAFLEMLEGVRKTRNKLMHFRPDISAVERDHLRFTAEWFKNYPPLTVEDDSAESDPLSFERRDEDSPVASEQEPTDDRFEDEDDGVESKPVESKYAPLAKFLLKLASRQERLIIHFSEIEEIIGDHLPAAAREHRSWWANDSTTHVQSRQWLKVNWRVVSINMADEKVTFARARDREQSYIKFFSAVQNKLRAHSDFPLHSANPTGANWLVLAYLGEGKASMNLSFGHQQRFRLEFYIDTGDREENNRIFGNLSRHRAEIESTMGQPLEWEPLEKRRASRIALYTEGSFSDEPEKLDALVDWAVENALRLYRAFREVLDRAL